jgi:hypothetical protein
MSDPAKTSNQNVLPVQAFFNLDGTFNTLLGQGQPFVITATESISIVNSSVNATLYPTFTSATSGQVTGLAIASPSLTWNPGTGVFSAPTFFGTLNGTANTANNLSGGGAGQIVYQNALGSTAYLAAGSTGQFLRSNGSSAPTWATVATSITISDQTTDTATYYPLFYSATSGSTNTLDTSSTKLQYQPSTGTFTATLFSGSGASLTNIPNGALTNNSVTIGSTSIALGATSTTLAGLTSVTATSFIGALTGNANTATTATNATNSAITDNTSSIATWYPTLVSTTSGNQPLNTSSTKLSFVPSTGVLSANGVALTGNLGTVTSVSVASANGFAGTVATSTTTPAITITTSITGILKGDGTAISAAVAADFPTLNQNTTGSAATLTTARAIYGNNFDGSAALTQIIASTYGGTGNGFTKFSGATTAEKTYTLPDANATLLYSGGPLGTPSSGTVTNLTGTASININGTVGATTASTGQFTTGAFGGTQSTAQQLLIGGNSQTASTTEYGVFNSQAVQSAVTTLYCGFNTSITTQASAFTAANIRHYQAGGFAVGSGSTVTNNVAFYIGAGLTGATNTYGVFGALASASGTWNLYLGGSADNYMAGRLGIGTTSLAGSQVTIGGNSQVDSTTEYGINSIQTVQSAVTVAYYGYRTGLSTQATAFTLTTLSHFIAQQGTFGSGSAVTTQAGFHVGSNMSGAVNNYGYYGNLASASNTFNIYMAGTASNYMAGSLGIGTATLGSIASSLVIKGITSVSASAPTIASATTIAPVNSIVFISGTAPIATITAPSPISLGGGQITLIPTGAFTTTTAGNIALASTAVVSKALIMTYDATTTKWYPSY